MSQPVTAFIEEVTERVCSHVLASNVRPATAEEITAAEELHAQGKCQHNIVTDSPGWLYDIRKCVTCGTGLGAI